MKVNEPDRIDELLIKFLLANSPGNVPPAPTQVTSPWEATLVKDEDSDEELE
jgi:hypothetical protein